jgi:hypothetical protein
MKNILMVMIGAGLLLFCATLALAEPAKCFSHQTMVESASVMDWPNMILRIRGTMELHNTSNLELQTTLETAPDGAFVVVGCSLDSIDQDRWRCQTDTLRATLRYRADTDRYYFNIRQVGWANGPSVHTILTEVRIGCASTSNLSEWQGTVGRHLVNRP